MDDLELAKTVESRLSAQPDLAKTLVQKPRETIQPGLRVGATGAHALEELRRTSGAIENKIAVHKTIGEGGMGVVHLATQATMGRHVAVKTLRGGLGDVDATLRVLREAWVTGTLEHPNVVPVYDVGVDSSGSPVIIMKRIEGTVWCDAMRERTRLLELFSTRDALEANVRVLSAVSNAIHFAHSRGILHRDVKPDNVMIGAFGEVYVLDWGIAVSMREDASGRLPPLSGATEIAGTPSYMAPEMLLGDPSALGPATDVYLLGAVFYEIFAGAPPHVGKNLQAMIASILKSAPTFPAEFPAEAKRICQKAMSREPSSRFASAEEFRVAIEDYLRHRGSRRLAFEAKQSLNALLKELEAPPSEERQLAVFNLLGECRFGYRAALTAWPENEAARRGLDRALLAVVDHELAVGDVHTAEILLREVSAPPPEVVARVDAAVKSRVSEEERLRRLERDLDPHVGTRTRTFIGSVFGVIWTMTPLAGWYWVATGHRATHLATFASSAIFLALGGVFRLWAAETMTKTLLNRRLGQTLGFHLMAQLLLATGAWRQGLSPEQSQTLHVFVWSLTETLLAIWVNRWFGVCAFVCASSFVAASWRPNLLYPLMSFCNLVFTYVLVRLWLPEADRDQIKARRERFRREAKRFLVRHRVDAGRAEEE